MDDRPALLFLSHRIPYPPDKGEKIRAWHIFRHLAQTHRMYLGCFIDDPADAVHLAHMKSLCADMMCLPIAPRRRKLGALARLRPGRPLTLGYFHDRQLQNWVDATLARHAIRRVFAFSAAMAPYAMRHDTMHHAGGRRVLDLVDIDSEKWTDYARTARGPMKVVWAREGRTLLAFEREAAARYDRTLFVSEQEWRRFVTLAPEAASGSGWIDNGVDLERFSPDHCFDNPLPQDERPSIVFTGTMDYRPNIDAVLWFAQAVVPALRTLVPAPRFVVVGANPGRAVRRLATPGGDVVVTGRVADTRPYLAHANAVVAPLRIARGIQNKVLEAMAMGRPVIASPQAFEGVRARAGQDLLVADGGEAMARAVAAVLGGRHPDLGAAGRRAVEAAYAWNATLRGLDELFADAAPSTPPPPKPDRALSPMGMQG